MNPLMRAVEPFSLLPEESFVRAGRISALRLLDWCGGAAVPVLQYSYKQS